jgi:hypothetical protein
MHFGKPGASDKVIGRQPSPRNKLPPDFCRNGRTRRQKLDWYGSRSIPTRQVEIHNM